MDCGRPVMRETQAQSGDKFEHPALILDGHYHGLWAARILGRHGIHVYVVASNSGRLLNAALFSKYCKGIFFVNGKWDDRECLKMILKKVARRFSKRLVVYPVTDLKALYLSEIQKDLADDYFLPIGEKESVETLVNKKKFYRELEKIK